MRATGRERVEQKLAQLNKITSKINLLKSKNKSTSPLTNAQELKLASLIERFKKARSSLAFLSTRARDPITRFYASNALKEISKSNSKQ